MIEKQHMEQNSHISRLTWLRGLAALFVVISHSIRATEVSYFQSTHVSNFSFFSLLDLGNYGVVLFFALSGCTLYISNYDKISSNSIIQFYIKRVFRIWPAFAISLFIYITFCFIFTDNYGTLHGHWIEKQFTTPFNASDVVTYLTLSFNVTGPSGLFNNAYWSLPVEFQYYLIFPLIIVSLKTLGYLGPILIGASLYLLPKLSSVELADNSFFALAFSFCGGILVAHHYKGVSYRLNNRVSGSLITLIILLIGMITNSYVRLPNWPLISSMSNWNVLLSVVVIYLVLFSDFKFSTSMEDFFLEYGNISYSTYLYHNLFIGSSVLVLIYFQVENPIFNLSFVLISSLFLTYYAAQISYRMIELPSIALGRTILRALPRPRTN